ncbi:MAG: WxcM-like domain-containing protein [Candidatus Aenigmarchaeota archaeon]|nr:WxcM-like domain-containing protein [Candidatus Aenigmarchaeota archaeon]
MKKKILTDGQLELKRQKYFSESGFLAELISSKYNDLPFENIHSYMVKIKKGFARANHYHLKKKEWITAVWAETELKLKNTETGETKEYLLDFEEKEQHSIVYIPPKWAHSVKAINNDSVVLVFSVTPEDKEDTYKYNVQL